MSLISPEIIITFLQNYGYFALLILSLFEGPIITIIAGFLASMGIFNIFLVYLIVLFSDVSSDIIMYSVGRFGKEKIIPKVYKKLKKRELKLLGLEKFYKNHGIKTIAIAKFIIGPGMWVQIGAGVAKMKFKKFLATISITSLVKSAFLVTLGYFFGHLYKILNNYINAIGAIVTTIVLTTAIILLIRKIITNKKLL